MAGPEPHSPLMQMARQLWAVQNFALSLLWAVGDGNELASPADTHTQIQLYVNPTL